MSLDIYPNLSQLLAAVKSGGIFTAFNTIFLIDNNLIKSGEA